jgi:hypothetical protein
LWLWQISELREIILNRLRSFGPGCSSLPTLARSSVTSFRADVIFDLPLPLETQETTANNVTVKTKENKSDA